ncbi:MAG: aconitate hydratase, partial [Rickettsiales bacterium]
IENTINNNDLIAVSILSGNRNFEGRIHQSIKANYLASPPLVIAYAFYGNINVNISTDPIAIDKNGNDVYLKDIWPSDDQIQEYVHKYVTKNMFQEKYADVFKGDELWQNIKFTKTKLYNWNKDSSYINHPPYFEKIKDRETSLVPIIDAKILAIFGDSITTDHISPAGNISKDSPAAKYLIEKSVKIEDFNSYGSRRGNHEVMMRGTFANIRIKNELLNNIEGGYSRFNQDDEILPIYDVAMKYKSEKKDLVIIAGKEYGTGSSRDWAAKGTYLLGVRAVIAESFERIHRSNLVGMGVIPLTFLDGINRNSLNLSGNETFTIMNLDQINPQEIIKCIIKRDKTEETVNLLCRIDTMDEMKYMKSGGILQSVIFNLFEGHN